jgi:hypothetical protein
MANRKGDVEQHAAPCRNDGGPNGHNASVSSSELAKEHADVDKIAHQDNRTESRKRKSLSEGEHGGKPEWNDELSSSCKQRRNNKIDDDDNDVQQDNDDRKSPIFKMDRTRHSRRSDLTSIHERLVEEDNDHSSMTTGCANSSPNSGDHAQFPAHSVPDGIQSNPTISADTVDMTRSRDVNNRPTAECTTTVGDCNQPNAALSGDVTTANAAQPSTPNTADNIPGTHNERELLPDRNTHYQAIIDDLRRQLDEQHQLVEELRRQQPSDAGRLLDIKSPNVDAWTAELSAQLSDDATKFINLSQLRVVEKDAQFQSVSLSTAAGELVAKRLLSLLESREEALQNVMKWQTAPPQLTVFPRWALYPRFAQRTDFSRTIHELSGQIEKTFVNLITQHFIASLHTIQQEIDSITNSRPECVRLLREKQCEAIAAKQKKSRVRFGHLTAHNSHTAHRSNVANDQQDASVRQSGKKMNNNQSTNAAGRAEVSHTINMEDSVNGQHVPMDTATAPKSSVFDGSRNNLAPWPDKPHTSTNKVNERRQNYRPSQSQRRTYSSHHGATRVATAGYNQQHGPPWRGRPTYSRPYYTNYAQRERHSYGNARVSGRIHEQRTNPSYTPRNYAPPGGYDSYNRNTYRVYHERDNNGMQRYENNSSHNWHYSTRQFASRHRNDHDAEPSSYYSATRREWLPAGTNYRHYGGYAY